VLTIAILVFPVKMIVCRQVEFFAIDQRGKPLGGVEIIRESGIPKFSFDYSETYTEKREVFITDDYGHVIVPEIKYHFMVWRIIQVEFLGLLMEHVNFRENIFSAIKINNVHVNIDELNYETLNHHQLLKIVIGECKDMKLYYCHYKCSGDQCAFFQEQNLSDEEFRKKYIK